MKGPCKAKSVS